MFLGSLVVCEINHDCTGECCPTCAILSIFEKMLTTAALCSAAALVLIANIIAFISRMDDRFVRNTPVSLKEKLLD